MNKPARFAILSVYNKIGIIDLAQALRTQNITLIATGGTAKLLTQHKVPFIPIEKITKKPESFDGRVKTISFEVMAGILFDRVNDTHLNEKSALLIPTIDFVICNLYPFWDKPGIEMIDIGGPTMVRAAAKNYSSVTVVTDPSDYKEVMESLTKDVQTNSDLRKKLATKAFSHITWYDSLISNYFQQQSGGLSKTISLTDGNVLRYGENPHQRGIFYKDQTSDTLGLGNFTKLQGKETSYSNYLDLDAGLQAISLIGGKSPSAVILKHTNPCGAAVNSNIADAFHKAWYDCDPLAAFGGVIVFNRPVNGKLAEAMLADKKFFEIVAAPSFTPEALTVFSAKPKLQLLQNPALEKPFSSDYQEIKTIRGGFLVQDADTKNLLPSMLRVVTKLKPSPEQITDLMFAWNMCKVCKSNCVVVAKGGVMLSSGVGQQDRKRCCELCVSKAIRPITGAVAATDGFFPFRDGPDVLIKAGISAIIQPGGSIRDDETIAACNEAGIAMVFTGLRAFKH